MPKWESEKITIGDLTFTAHYKDGVLDNNQKKNLDSYAVKLMEMHFRFYGSLRERESEFVTEDSIVYCTKGLHTTGFGVMKDHGIYRKDMKPIMTCNDCVSGENIYSFGICRCPESTFNNTYPRPVDTVEYIDNREPNGERYGSAFVPISGPRCIPMLTGYWKQGECSTMIWDGTVGDYVPALLDTAYQVCFYGGVITILGTPEQGINLNPGWLQLSNGKWMYITQEGKAVVSDWLIIDGKKYHFDSGGYMDIGLVWISDNYYFFHADGHLASSEWIEDPDEKYWVNKEGIWDGSFPDPEEELRDKIISAAIWYKDGCGQNIKIVYSMNKRGTDPNGKRHKLFIPWQAYSYLDCSGYVGAVYTTAGIPDFDANDPMDCLNTSKLRANSRTYKITKEDLLPGDLVFKNSKPAGGENHVGIFSHFDANGNIVAYDCGTKNGIQLRKIPNYWENNSSVYYRYIKFMP